MNVTPVSTHLLYKRGPEGGGVGAPFSAKSRFPFFAIFADFRVFCHFLGFSWFSGNFTKFQFFLKTEHPSLPTRKHQYSLRNIDGFEVPFAAKSTFPCKSWKFSNFRRCWWKRVPIRKIHDFVKMATLPSRTPPNHQYSLRNIDGFASGPGKLGFHHKSRDPWYILLFLLKSRYLHKLQQFWWKASFPGPEAETSIFLEEYWWFWGALHGIVGISIK